jgi:cobalamin biosynthesis Mg chelatase CobN
MKNSEHKILQIQADARKIMRIIVLCMFVFATLFCLASCSVRKKEVVKEDTKTETATKEVVETKKDSSVKVIEENKQTEIETEVEFNGGKDLVIQDNNSTTRISGSGKVKIKRVDKITSKNKETAVKSTENSDKEVNEEKKITSVVKNKSVKDTGLSFIFYLWLFLLLIIALILYLYSRKLDFFS